MQIFCKETQAHLDMNPHLRENNNSNTNLITPDLWLKNCRSRSASPNSDQSKNSSSPTLTIATSAVAKIATAMTTTISSSTSSSFTSTTMSSGQRSSRPLISITPAVKLLPNLNLKNSPLSLSSSMRCPPPVVQIGSSPSTTLLRHPSRRRRSLRLSSVNGHLNNNNSSRNSENNSNKSIAIVNNSSKSSIETAHEVDATCSEGGVSDIRPLAGQSIGRPPFVMPPTGFFATLPNDHTMTGVGGVTQRFLPPFMGHDLHSPSHLGQPPLQASQPPPPSIPPSTADAPFFARMAQMLGTGLPPVTVLVPYPVVLPLPIPFAIPLSLECLLKAAELRLIDETLEMSKHSPTQSNVWLSPKVIDTDDTSSKYRKEAKLPMINDQPLDCTKTKNHVDESVDLSTGVQLISCSNVSDADSNEHLDDVHGRWNDRTHRDNHPGRPLTTNVLLPNSKTSRLHVKRSMTKECESSRPLRKRKRIIDCDYSQMKDAQRLE